LSQCELSGDFLVKFFASLPGVPTSEEEGRIDSNLHTLNLQDNPINAEGFKALLPLITNSALKQLNVSKCQINDEAVKCFRISNPAYTNDLHLLDLSHNDLTSVGAQCLSLALESPNTVLFQLIELNLAGNNLGEYGVQMLSDALVRRRREGSPQTLEKLDLADTNCGTQGAIEIITKGNLKSLHLFNNKLGSDGFIALSTTLTGGHATLENLDLGGNQANQAAVVVLLSALIEKEPQNSEEGSATENRLKLLVVGGNEGGDAVEQIVARIEQVYPTLDIARDKKAQRPE
jgi:Leucine Rich repeat